MPLDIGFSELLMIMTVVLVVLGPGKIPELARGLGGFMREVRNVANTFTSELMGEQRPTGGPQRACAHCGSLNPLSHRYCSSCGADLIPSTPTSTTPPPPTPEREA